MAQLWFGPVGEGEGRGAWRFICSGLGASCLSLFSKYPPPTTNRSSRPSPSKSISPTPPPTCSRMAQWSNSSPLRQDQSTPEAAVTSLNRGGPVRSASSANRGPSSCSPPLPRHPAPARETVKAPTRNRPPRHHVPRDPRVGIMVNPPRLEL